MNADHEMLVLVADENEHNARFIADNLVADGYEVHVATTPGDAKSKMTSHVFDVVVADLNGSTGEFVKSFAGDVPIVVLTARQEAAVRIAALRDGAQDVMLKPFSYAELRLRLGRLVERTRERNAGRRLRSGSLIVDLSSRVVTVAGEQVRVSKKEFHLLSVLASQPERVFTKAELMRTIWGPTASYGMTRTLDSHCCRLRGKLAEVDGSRWIVNVWGVGYRLSDPVGIDLDEVEAA